MVRPGGPESRIQNTESRNQEETGRSPFLFPGKKKKVKGERD
jgi:hypothetical protein